MRKVDLKELIERARGREAPAFAEIVRRFRPGLLRLAGSKLSDSDLAEDVVQEAFFDAYAKIDQLRHPEAFSTWIRSIVHKHCDRILRKPKEFLQSPDKLANVEDTRRERIDWAQIFSPIPDEDRRVAEAFYIEEKAQIEIADELGIPLHAVKTRLDRARKVIRRSRELYMTGRGVSWGLAA